MMFIEKNKAGYLVPDNMDKRIAFMLLDQFFDCLNYIKKEIVQ